MIDRFYYRVARLLTQWPGVILCGLAAVTLAAFLALPRLAFDFTPQAVFAGRHDLVETAERFKETFGHDDAIVLVLLEATGDREIVTPAPLMWLDAIEQRALAIPEVAGARSLASASVPTIVKPRPIRLGLIPLVPYLDDVEDADLGRVRAALEQSEDLRRAYLSEDGKLAVAYVDLRPEARTMDGMRAAVEALEAALLAEPPPEGFRAALSGLPELRVAIVRSLQQEQARLLPIAGVMFFAVLAVLLRSLLWAGLPLLAVGLGLAWTVGAIAVIGSPFNIVTNVLPLLLFTLGTANAVHIVNRFGEELERAPGERLLAARRTISHLGLACLLTTLTTAVGFGSLALSGTVVLRELAWEAALGLGLVYLSTLGLLGALLPRLPNPWARRPAGQTRPWGRTLRRLADVTLARPRTAVVCCLAVLAGSVWLAGRVVVDSSMLEVYDADHPQSLRIRDVEARLGGFISLDVELSPRAGHEGQPLALDEATFRAVLAFEAFAAAQPGVLTTFSYARALEAVRTTALAPAGGKAQGEATAAEILASYEAIEEIAPEVGLARFLSADASRARIQLRVEEMGTRRTLALMEALSGELASLLPADGPVTARLTGDAALNAQAMDGFVRDLFWSLGLASALIFGLMTLLFGSPLAGATAALPNLTPLVITLGYMGLREYPMNAGNAIVFTIGLGVAVDDTVHFLARAREEMRKGRSLDDAIRGAMEGAGPAMVMTSLLIVLGLAVLLASDFVPNRRFAELTALTMASALIGDLLLLPACMKLLWGKAAKNLAREGIDPPVEATS